MGTFSPLPFPDVLNDLDWNRWAVDDVPDLGGDAFFYEGDSILTGVRVAPPPMGPHSFHRERKAKKDGGEKTATIDPSAGDKRPQSKRREDRGESCQRVTLLSGP